MNMHTELVSPENASPLIDILSRACSEMDGLTIGENQIGQQDAEQEADHVARQWELGGFTLLAWSDRSRKRGGPQLLGMCSVDVDERPSMRHRAKLSLAVSSQFMGQGVDERLMQECIARVTRTQGIEMLGCEVRSGDAHTVRLLERFGLEQTGTLRGFYKVGDKMLDAIAMSRIFHRDHARPDKPLFYLDDILEAIDLANDNTSWYACLDTGEVEVCFQDGWGDWEDEDGFDPETAEGRWEYLPDRFEIDDWACMRDFASMQEGPVCKRLLDLIHRRGAYRNFKDECARRGLLEDYYAFQDERHRRVAIDWLEDHDCVWTEGSRLA